MSYDGIQNSNRVENTTERKLHAKVVDNILHGTSLYARFMGNAKKFSGKTMDFTIKVVDSAGGQYFQGMELLGSNTTDTTVTLSYANTGFSQHVVLPLLESFANEGPEQTIDLDQNKLDEAVAEAKQKLGTDLYTSIGTGGMPLGLAAIVDDGTDVTTIGGQSRSTYTNLKAKRTDFGNTLSLSKLGTLEDNITAAGVESEQPTIHAVGKTVWGLYEQLLHPTVRADYSSVGYPAISIRGNEIMKTRALLKGHAGFTVLTYRGVPVIKDDAAPASKWFMLNENYIFWAGRTAVPSKWKGKLSKVDLGAPATFEGVPVDMPSEYNGWFYQDLMPMPNQAGMIGRYYVIGQYMSSQPRRNAVGTNINGI